MTIAERVDVGKGSEGLIGVQFDQERRNGLLHLVVVFKNAVDRLGNVVHHHIQIYLVLL